MVQKSVPKGSQTPLSLLGIREKKLFFPFQM
jgi:hypothetical protein